MGRKTLNFYNLLSLYAASAFMEISTLRLKFLSVQDPVSSFLGSRDRRIVRIHALVTWGQHLTGCETNTRISTRYRHLRTLL